ASSNYAQPGFPAGNAIDGDAKTGWAIGEQMGRSHVALFELKEPLSLQEGQVLTMVLDQQYGGRHTLGRLRLSATTATPPVLVHVIPDSIGQILAVAPEQRTLEQRAELSAH